MRGGEGLLPSRDVAAFTRPHTTWLTRLLALAVLGAGSLGLVRYVDNFWVYRGYPAPHDPSFVTERGRTIVLELASPALGGRRQRVDVYLPPGYERSVRERYPVLYLLHGVPGRPESFLAVVRAGVIDDVLVATHRARPLIVVMPFGSTGIFTDKEWANGLQRTDQWETFVARDLVRAVDEGFRTIPSGAGRAIGGLSEGGYGALNIALHHPGEFGVVESWSGYERATDVRSIFGHDPARLAYNSPLAQIANVAAALRRAGTYFWFYSGKGDRTRTQNDLFAAELTRLRIRHTYIVRRGGHDWRLWRDNAERAILAAEAGVGHA